MSGLSLNGGMTLSLNGGVSGGTSLLSVGALFAAFGDGVMSDGACPGQRNAILLAYEKMSGRILPSERMNMCASGDDFDIGYARLAYAVAQQPTIFMVGSRGANDNIMSTDPAGAPGIALMDKWERDIDYASTNLGANCRKIICATTLGSLDVGESTHAASVNAAMIAYINGHADSRIVLWDAWALYNHTNCTDLSPASDTPKVHPDDRGARQLAFGDGSNDGLYDVLDALVASATHAEIFTALAALGTNFDTDVALKGGTGGTKSGTIPPTGNWPTGKRITNNLTDGTAVGVVCSIDTTDPDYYEAVAVVSGDPAATNTIVMDDTASISATGSTPGRFYAPILGLRIDDGAGGAPTAAMTWNIAWSNFGNLGSTTDHSSVLTNGIGRAVDAVLVCQPNPTFSSSGPFSANPALTVRFFNAAITTRIKYRRPMLVELYATARAQPHPLWKAVGETSNYVQRLTGTFSNTSTIRVEPGRWSGGGLTDTTIATRKIYETLTNSGADAVVGAGTEMTSLTGSTWTWVASGLTAGRFLWVDVTVNNGVGSAVTERAGPYTIV